MSERISATVLIIEDDEDVLTSLSLYLKLHFERVLSSNTPKEINELMSQHDIPLILLDMNFSKGVNDGREGLYWLRHINEVKPRTAVIMLTAYGNIELAVESLKQGASDFLVKPWNNQKLLSILLRALELNQTRNKIQKLETANRQLIQAQENQPLIESKSSNMLSILKTANKVADTDAHVLIRGENGTGKEVLARHIHNRSARAALPFVSLDLGTLNENLFEAELFGYKKGAFTDAKEDKPGRMELAEGGTLFLDEIGNIPLSSQAKLLTAIQSKSFTPLGGRYAIHIDCRIICATNLNLDEALKLGTFRQDLLYRINTIELEIPALRNRREDIPVLSRHFMNYFNKKYHRQAQLMQSTVEELKNHSWPGNIRELKHVMERGLILAEHDQIGPSDLRLSKISDTDQKLELEEIEKKHIGKVLERFQGNISQAARALNINRNTLYRKIEKYGF